MLAYRSLCMFYFKLHQQKSSCKCPADLRKGKEHLESTIKVNRKKRAKEFISKGSTGLTNGLTREFPTLPQQSHNSGQVKI